MVHILKKGEFLGNEDIVNCAYMLRILGEANPARMRNDRHAKPKQISTLSIGALLVSHEQHRQHFIDPTQTTSVYLCNVDRLGLE
jgi:hypothetical protein